MIIKKFTAVTNPDTQVITNEWVSQAVETTAQSIKTTMGGASIFDEFDKIKTPHLPDVAFGGMKFVGTFSKNTPNTGFGPMNIASFITGANQEGYTVSQNLDALTGKTFPGGYAGIGQSYVGHYWVVSSTGTEFDGTTPLKNIGVSDQLTNDAAKWQANVTFDDGVAPFDNEGFGFLNQVFLEVGDWIVITGWDNVNSRFRISVINNTYALADVETTGIVKLGFTTLGKDYKVDTTSAGLFVNVPWVSDEISTTEIDTGNSSTTRLITGRRAQHLLRNNVTAATTANFAAGATTTGLTKAVNLGTGGLTGSTTNVVIGSAVAGTTTISSPTTNVSALGATSGTFSGDIAVNGGDITTSSATFKIGNTVTNANQTLDLGTAATTGLATVVKTVNLGTGSTSSATTNVNIGSASNGTTTINSKNTVLFGDLEVNGGDIITSSGTLNVGNPATSATTLNLGTAATANATTKAVNLGTGGATGSTTNVIIGSATGGTTTIASGTTNVAALGATSTITSRPAAANDAVILSGRAGGTGTFGVTLIPETLTANRTLTLPNLTGTLALTSDLHTRSHAITSTSDHTATAWRLFHSNGAGQVVEIGLGTSGHILRSNGAAAAPAFAAETVYTGGEGITLTGTAFSQTYPVYHGDTLPTSGVSLGAFGFEF